MDVYKSQKNMAGKEQGGTRDGKIQPTSKLF